MDWTDCEFVQPGSEDDSHTSVEKTGWETVVFVIEDEESDG